MSRPVIDRCRAAIVAIEIGITDKPHADDVGRTLHRLAARRLQRLHNGVVSCCFEGLAKSLEVDVE